MYKKTVTKMLIGTALAGVPIGLTTNLSVLTTQAAIISSAYTDNQGLIYTVNTTAKTAIVTSYTGAAAADIIIPDTIDYAGVSYPVTEIGASAFLNSGIHSVVIGDNVTNIQTSAFQTNSTSPYYKTALTSVTFGKSVSTIRTDAFGGNALTSLNFPDSLTSIGTRAFANNLLTSVSIGSSVTSVMDKAFQSNVNLSAVSFDAASTATIGSLTFSGDPVSQLTLGTNTVWSSDALNKISPLFGQLTDLPDSGVRSLTVAADSSINKSWMKPVTSESESASASQSDMASDSGSESQSASENQAQSEVAESEVDQSNSESVTEDSGSVDSDGSTQVSESNMSAVSDSESGSQVASESLTQSETEDSEIGTNSSGSATNTTDVTEESESNIDLLSDSGSESQSASESLTQPEVVDSGVDQNNSGSATDDSGSVGLEEPAQVSELTESELLGSESESQSESDVIVNQASENDELATDSESLAQSENSNDNISVISSESVSDNSVPASLTASTQASESTMDLLPDSGSESQIASESLTQPEIGGSEVSSNDSDSVIITSDLPDSDESNMSVIPDSESDSQVVSESLSENLEANVEPEGVPQLEVKNNDESQITSDGASNTNDSESSNQSEDKSSENMPEIYVSESTELDQSEQTDSGNASVETSELLNSESSESDTVLESDSTALSEYSETSSTYAAPAIPSKSAKIDTDSINYSASKSANTDALESTAQSTNPQYLDLSDSLDYASDAPASYSDSALPDTGERSNTLLSVIGLLILAGITTVIKPRKF